MPGSKKSLAVSYSIFVLGSLGAKNVVIPRASYLPIERTLRSLLTLRLPLGPNLRSVPMSCMELLAALGWQRSDIFDPADYRETVLLPGSPRSWERQR